MTSVFLLEAVFFAVALPVLCLTAIIIAAIIRFGKGNRVDPAETRLIQEMHRNLETLETRIESLETIVLAHERSSRKGV